MKQTHKIHDSPIIIFGTEYHKKLLEHIAVMKRDATIGEKDVLLYLVTDDIDEAVALIREKSIKQFGLKPAQKPKPLRWLLERA